MRLPRILLLQAGENAEVASEFAANMFSEDDRDVVEFEVAELQKGAMPKHPFSEYAGVVVSGSRAMVRRPPARRRPRVPGRSDGPTDRASAAPRR